MDIKRLIHATAAVTVFALAWNGIVHGLILAEADAALAGFARPAQERSLAVGLLLTLGIALAFVLSYVRCARTGGLADGLRHGVYFALLAGLLVDLNQYLLYPIPASLALQWFLSGLAEFSCYGLLVSRIYPLRRAGGAVSPP